MFKKKKKILFISEASYSASGFARYYYDLISRLHATNKYELAELAQFSHVNDPRDSLIKWRFYANEVPQQDPRFAEFSKNEINKFCKWRFEKVLLDFTPDFVCTLLDPAMSYYHMLSPLRKYFHYVISPTVDSAPQVSKWLDYFRLADGVLTYSQFGYDTLEKELPGQIKLFKNNPAGVDFNVFKPINRKQIRKEFNLHDKFFIVGTMMRNQPRKLFVNLLNSFKKYLDITKEKNPSNYSSSYLLCHTTFPDINPWNLEKVLIELGLTNRVLFTYKCQSCKKIFVNFWQDYITCCKYCNGFTASSPKTHNGVEKEDLNKIYNLMDCYVQYSNCFAKGQKILTNKGWVAIDEVQVGDMAWTHKNRWRKIINTWSNLEISAGEKIIDVKAIGNPFILTASENHQLYSLGMNNLNPLGTTSKNRSQAYLKKNIKQNKKIESVLKPISELKKGDLLEYPINLEIKENPFLQFDNLEINIDKNFAKFIGLFAADGSWDDKGSIKITSHIKDTKNHKITRNGLSLFSNKITTRVYKNRNANDIYISRKQYIEDFKKYFGKGAEKKLPDECLIWPIEIQKYILEGLFLGDGSYNRTKAGNYCSSYCTISEILAKQIREILHRLGLKYNLSKTKRSQAIHNDGKNRQDIYAFEIYNCDIKKGEFNQPENQRSSIIYHNDKVYFSIKEIKESEYKGNLYNIEVEEDHSMTSEIVAAKQCEGLGFGSVEAAAVGIPILGTAYSATKSINDDLGGININIKYMQRDPGVDAYRAIPDDDHLAEELYKMSVLPTELNLRKGSQVRNKCMEFYNSDKNAKIWEEYFDSAELTGKQGKWGSEIELPDLNYNPIQSLSNSDFTYDLLTNLLKDESISHSYYIDDLVRGLIFNNIKGTNQTLSKEQVFNIIKNMAREKADVENIRVGISRMAKEDFLHYAEIKALSNL